MQQLEIERFRARLLELQSELTALGAISKDSTSTVVLDQSSVGRLSRMDALQGQQMALNTERRRQQELRNIKAALARVDNGDYGYCATCGEQIAIARLTINPTAVKCVNCSD